MGDTNELSYLESQSLEEQEDESQRPSCFVGTVGPQAVCSSRDAQHTYLVQDERWKWIPKVYTGPYYFLAIKILVFNKIIPRVYLYEGESNENRKNFFKFNLLNESGTQLYYFST
jgi:hypothetical protein